MLLDILLALSPIILILLIIFIWKKPLTIAAPITYVYTVFLALLVWRIFFSYILISALKGLLVAVDITIIIFGAIFFLQFLKETEILKSLDSYISSISRDRRIQAILLVWFFGSFIEGTAGFGTPAAIVAPLLVGLGFPALIAVAIALIGNSTAVPFGAVGTPIRIGLSGVNANMASVAFYTGLINLFAGIIVPLMIASVVVLSTTRKGKKFERIKEITPFALYSGIMLTIPYFLFTFLGQEFPSLLGPLVGMFIVGFTTKKGFLIPKNTLEFDSSIKKQKSIRPEKLLKSLSPYLILVLFLILGKVYLPSFTISLINNSPHTLN
ncbi:MAG: L-lactate permease [Candidatus Nanoarchaeia archaeon]